MSHVNFKKQQYRCARFRGNDLRNQCSKLRVHPAPGVHNLAAGCTDFATYAPGECTLFQSVSIIARCMILCPSAPGVCTKYMLTMFEIKGAPCTRRVHRF